jgi:hypothetical protein
MWTHEASIETSAGPARVWALFADVEGWKEWNAGIEAIELHGPFATGTTFTMQPPGQEPFQSTLIEVREKDHFTDETVLDRTRVVVRQALEPLPSGRTRIAYRTEITGPEAGELGPLVTADFPAVLAALKELAERP